MLRAAMSFDPDPPDPKDLEDMEYNGGAHKVSDLIDMVNQTFKMAWVLRQHLSLDESLAKFKGRHRFKVYMKLKPGKWGFKFWNLCESKSPYIWHIELYTGGVLKGHKKPAVEKRATSATNSGHSVTGYHAHVHLGWHHRELAPCVHGSFLWLTSHHSRAI